jgi:hypothetical protein
MKTIHKYGLDVVRVQTVELPAHAEILSVQVQHGRPVMWAIVEDQNSKVQRTVVMQGTGWELPHYVEKKDFIGTVQLVSLVFHFFIYG